MPYADAFSKKEFQKRYVSKEFVFRPTIFKRDLNDSYIEALRIQAAIKKGTISSVISDYVKKGLIQDGIIKPKSS